jgi:hypothetical protein
MTNEVVYGSLRWKFVATRTSVNNNEGNIRPDPPDLLSPAAPSFEHPSEKNPSALIRRPKKFYGKKFNCAPEKLKILRI